MSNAERPKGKHFRGTNSILRALRIIEIMADRREPMGVSELAQMIKLDPSTTYRILASLVASGWANQSRENRRYYVALKVATLGALVQGGDPICYRAVPVLKKLCSDWDETARLATLDGGETVLLAHETASRLLMVNVDLLDRAPSYCTAAGKAILAAMSPAQVEARLADVRFERRTPKTVASLPALLHDLQSVRERGYALDEEEYILGVNCVTAAILDHFDNPVASIGLTGPTVRMTPDQLAVLGEAVVAAAQKVSATLATGLENEEGIQCS